MSCCRSPVCCPVDVYKRQLIKSVADRAGVEIILAFKSFAMWRSFPIFREYIRHSTASSVYEARLALEEFGSKAHTYSPAYTERDFPEIMRCSSHITFNSMAQFERFYSMTVADVYKRQRGYHRPLLPLSYRQSDKYFPPYLHICTLSVYGIPAWHYRNE